MKIVKFLLATLLLALPLALVSAQDAAIAEETIGTFTIESSTGSFADDVLTLGELGDSAIWFFAFPTLRAGGYTPAELAADWAVENLEVEGALVLKNMTALVTVKVSNFDAVKNTVSFDVVVNEIVTTEEVKGGPEVPASFEDARLVLSLNKTFIQSLITGFNNRTEGTRSNKPCGAFC